MISEIEKAGAPERVSTTNVQVAGIDEPDIVKTDGKHIYISSEAYYYPVEIYTTWRSWYGKTR
ncbi:MAG TPA: hypothetical protein ENG00_01165, partial [Candidatus Aenigmarchaeota archaeon]|nr:hypothetical protein [Candidatus Aenigmarchaeota archaeon]